MIDKQSLDNLISKMTDNDQKNIKLITRTFNSLNYRDSDNQTILHILADNKYDEFKCYLAIRTLLKNGLNPNAHDDFNYNFIQTALYAGYSVGFILNIIKEALRYGLDVNHVDDDKDTIMHTAIYSDDYHDIVSTIYRLLIANGFESTKVDHNGRNIVEAMVYMNTTNQKPYTQAQIAELKELYQTQVKTKQSSPSQKQDNPSTPYVETNNTIQPPPKPQAPSKPTITLSPEMVKELEKYGQILNLKHYLSAPTIGRDTELKELLITLASDKKSLIIVGESGVGKTAIIDELAYRIQNGQVPRFLEGKIILEVSPSDLVAGTRYTGTFEEKLTKLLKLCDKYNVLLFIDEIHTIYGAGSHDKSDTDMADMLKHYIDRSNIKVIGATTTEEYTKYFGTDALKRRFEKIKITEPTEDILKQIIYKVITDYSNKNNLFFKEEYLPKSITLIIATTTAKSHRVYDDVVNNPDLAISIIDKAFAYAKYNDSDSITAEYFIESFASCHRISEPAKQQAIASLKNIGQIKNIPFTRILKFEKPKP